MAAEDLVPLVCLQETPQEVLERDRRLRREARAVAGERHRGEMAVDLTSLADKPAETRQRIWSAIKDAKPALAAMLKEERDQMEAIRSAFNGRIRVWLPKSQGKSKTT